MKRKNQWLRLRGTQVFLRYPQKEDAGEFIALNEASRRFHRGLANPPLSLSAFDDFLAKNDTEANECFFICREEDGKIAGSISLSQIYRGGFQNAYLGYYVGASFSGQGLVTEAIGLILRYAFRELRLHRIEANVQPHNLASIAVLRKNGFTKEGYSRRYLKIGGRWCDHERWAIIAEDWTLRKKQ